MAFSRNSRSNWSLENPSSLFKKVIDSAGVTIIGMNAAQHCPIGPEHQMTAFWIKFHTPSAQAVGKNFLAPSRYEPDLAKETDVSVKLGIRMGANESTDGPFPGCFRVVNVAGRTRRSILFVEAAKVA